MYSEEEVLGGDGAEHDTEGDRCGEGPDEHRDSKGLKQHGTGP